MTDTITKQNDPTMRLIRSATLTPDEIELVYHWCKREAREGNGQARSKVFKGLFVKMWKMGGKRAE
jgi:hypothetical protein